jgi:hypothetical protein
MIIMTFDNSIFDKPLIMPANSSLARLDEFEDKPAIRSLTSSERMGA